MRAGAVCGLLALAGSVPVVGPALSQGAVAPAAEKPVQLAIAHWVPPAHPLHKSLQAWIADVNAESGGTLTARVFPAEQLGKAVDHYDMARDGIADMTLVNPGYQPGRFPILAAGELPFLSTDAKQASGAIDAWYRAYAEKEMKDVHYCMLFIHDPGVFHSRHKIAVPSDIKGMKVRPANATIGAWIRLMGGSNVQASAPAARDLLEHGVADAITNPWGSTILFGIDKVTDYHLDEGMYGSIQMWVMNKAKYNALGPRQKKAIDDHCTSEWTIRFVSPWVDFEHEGRAKMAAEKGHILTPMTPEALKLWQDSAKPLKKRWSDRIRARGLGDPDQMFGGLEASLVKYNAAYDGK